MLWLLPVLAVIVIALALSTLPRWWWRVRMFQETGRWR